MTTQANIFGLKPDDTTAFKPALVVGQGLPPDVGGQPATYWWKEMLPLGDFRDISGQPSPVDAKRIDTIVSCYSRAKAKGYKAFLPLGGHRVRDKNLGWLIDVRKNARGALEGLHQIIGKDAACELARNGSSICTLKDVTDETGEHYEELIDHNAILPDPQAFTLGDFQPFNPALAASRGQPIDATFLALAREAKEPDMDISALRKAVGAADTVPDADVISQAAAKLATIPTLEAAKTTAETAAATARTELSRRTPPSDDFPAAIATGSVNILHRQVELMAREGTVTAEQAAAAKALIGTADKPNTLALSRTGADHPAEKWLEVLALGKGGVKANGESRTGAQVVELSRTASVDVVSGGSGGQRQQTPEEIAAAVDANLKQTELGRRAIAARKIA